MKIVRTSQLTGKKHSMDLPVTMSQMKRFYSGKASIQNIFPDLSPSQREFILTGITEEEWDANFDADAAAVLAGESDCDIARGK